MRRNDSFARTLMHAPCIFHDKRKLNLFDEAVLQRTRAHARRRGERDVLVARDPFGVSLEIWRNRIELLLLWVQDFLRLAFKTGKHDSFTDGGTLRRDDEINLSVIVV